MKSYIFLRKKSIIKGFLSAVWAHILMASIHCRESIGEQVI